MSRDGLIRENMTTGETENISAKARENPPPDNVISDDVTSEKIPKRKSSRLTFTEEEERKIPELQKYIKKSDQAADRLDKARDKIPKKKTLSFDREFDERSGKVKTRLRFEEKLPPRPEPPWTLRDTGSADRSPLSLKHDNIY